MHVIFVCVPPYHPCFWLDLHTKNLCVSIFHTYICVFLEATSSFFPPLIYQVAFSSDKSNDFGSSGGKFDYVSFDILEISAAAAAIPVPIFKVHMHQRKLKPSTPPSEAKHQEKKIGIICTTLHDAFISGSLSNFVHKKNHTS